MLRSQTTSSFYVCASCRRQHQRNLAQLRSTGRAHSHNLSSLSRPSSSNILTVSKRSSSKASRDASIRPHDFVLSRATRRDIRHYGGWGKFGSNMVRGQSNSAWGGSSKNDQGQAARNTNPSSAWGGSTAASRMPPATGTSAWGGRLGGGLPPARSASPMTGSTFGSGLPPVQPTTAWGSALRQPHMPSAAVRQPGSSSPGWGSGTTGSFSSQQPHPRDSAQRPAAASAVQPPDMTGSDLGQPRSAAPAPTLPSQQPTTPSQSMAADAETNSWSNGDVRPSDPSTSSSATTSAPVSSPPGSSQPGQLPSARLGSGAGFGTGFGALNSMPSVTASGNRQTFGQLNNSWNSNRLNPLGGPSDVAPGKPRFGPKVPLQPTSGSPGLSLDELRRAAEARDASVANLSPKPAPAPAPPAPAPAPTPHLSSTYRSPVPHLQAQHSELSSRKPQDPLPESSLKGRSSRPPSEDIFADNSFPKPPSRSPPPGAEFPQLRRKGSREDLFESMSPWNLPRIRVFPPSSLGNSKSNSVSNVNQRTTPASPRQEFPRMDRKDPHLIGGAPSDLESAAESDPAHNTAGFESATASTHHHSRRDGPEPSKPLASKSWTKPQTSQHQAGIELEGEFASQPLPRESRWASTPPISADQFDVMMQEPTVSQIRKTRKLDQGDQGLSSPNEKTRKLDQGDQNSLKAEAGSSTFEVSRAPNPRVEYPNSRSLDDRRGRGRNRDLDDEELDSRGKGKPKKKSNNRRRHGYDDDERDGGFDYEQAMAIREQRLRAREEKRAAKEALAPKTILLPEYIAVYDLAEALRVKPRQFLKDLEQLGFENILNDSVMTGETAALVAAEYGFDPTVDTGEDEDLKPRLPPEDPSTLPLRPPVVTIMGHVDHGKTTILDWMRKSSVAAGEHGGITQHIGAFSVKLKAGKLITFLDTPGHAAFLSMRQRGANVTDIVVLVVAVDDSVMPQTIEAIKHAQSANVPMIVAINKIDIDDDPKRIEKIKSDLANNNVEIEDFGGDVQVVAVSGVTGRGMDDLEESILTISEILDIRAEPDGMAEGWVLEASVKPDGRAATVLVKRGTLRVGDLLVAGTTYTRIRIMRNNAGTEVKEAGPGTPVEVYGWKQQPMAGDMVLQAPNETKAQSAVDYRQELAERAEAAAQKAQKELTDREEADRKALQKMMEEEQEESDEAAAVEPGETGPKIFHVIIKGDVHGSVEAVANAVQELGNNEVRTRILVSSPGQITESDVDRIAMANGCIVNFNNAIPGSILRRADDAGVKILDHNIIYKVVEDVKSQLLDQMTPIFSQKVLAEAECVQVFPINIMKRIYKNVAGVKVTNGTVTRGGLYKVMRDGEKIHQGKLQALKEKQRDISEVRKGSECGMMFEDYDDLQPGDVIQLYKEIRETRYL